MKPQHEQHEERSGPAKPAAEPSVPNEGVIDAISAMEAQLESLRKAATERQALQEALDARERHLDERDQSLKKREAELASQLEDLDRDLGVIEQEKTSLHEQKARVEAEQSRLEELRADTNERSSKIEARARELEVAEAKLTDQANRLQDRLRQMEQNEQDAISRLKQLEAHIAQVEKERDQALQECETAQGALREVESSLQAMNARAARAEEELEQRRAEVDALTQRAEQFSELSEQLRNELNDRTEELDKAREDCERIERETVHKLENFVQKIEATQQSASQAEQQIAEYKSKVERLEQQVHELEAQLTGAESRAQSAAGQSAEKLAELEQAIRARDELIKQRDTQIADLESKLTTAAQKITEFGKFIEDRIPANGADDGKALAEALEARAKLEQQVEALHKRLDAATGPGEDSAGRYQSDPAARDMAHLALRRQRLQKVRAALRRQELKVRRANELLQDRFEQCEELLSRRAEVAAAHEAVREQREKASRQRKRAGTAGAMLAFVVMTGILFGLSWIVAQKVFPGKYAASAIVSADGGDRRLSQEALEEWNNYAMNLFEDPRFMETVADMLGKRGIASLGAPGLIQAELETSLTAESPTPGEIHLEYRGIGATRTERVLETVSVAIARTANRTRSRRTDGAMTQISSPAKVGNNPIAGNQLVHAASIFGGGMFVTLLFGSVVWGRMSRSKSEFERDQQLQALLSEARWQDPRIDLDASESHENQEQADTPSRKGRKKSRKK